MKRLIIILGTIWFCSSFLFDAEAYIHQATSNSHTATTARGMVEPEGFSARAINDIKAEQEETKPARATPSTAVQPQNKDVWLTAGKQVVVLPNLGAGQPIKLDVAENARRIVVSPDGRLVAVASYGAVKTGLAWGGGNEVWPEAANRSQITLVKRPGYEIAAQYPVPFRPEFIDFTSDSATLVCVSLGQVSKNEKKHIAPQVFLLDVASGKLRGQVDLASEPIEPWFAATNRLLIPCRGFEKRAGAAPELVIYDVIAGKAEKTALPSPPERWIETGAEDPRYLEMGNSVVRVDADGKMISPIFQAGADKLFLQAVPNSHRFLLAGKTKKQGQLIVIEDGRAVKTLEVPPLGLITFDDKATRMFLCAPKQGFIYDVASLTEVAKIPLPGTFRGVSFAPGEKRLYVNEVGDDVTVVDLETKQVVTRFGTGRGGIKFLQEMGAAAASAFSGVNYGIHTDYYVKRAVQSLAFSPSGNFVYVFNSQTHDITVVETKGHTISPRKVPTGDVGTGSVYGASWGWGSSESKLDLAALGFLWLTTDGRYLVSCGLNKLLVFDTEKGEVLTEREFKFERRRPADGIEPRPLRYEPSLDLIFARSASGTEVYRPGPFEKIKDFGPESALPSDKATKRQFAAVKDMIFQPEVRRFFLVTTKGVGVYDYDLNLLRMIEGLSGVEQVHLISPQAEMP